MRKKVFVGLASLVIALTGGPTVQAQTYSNAVMALNPAAYWPLGETNPPPAGYVATNYGTLGSLGNGYYENWYQASGNTFSLQSTFTGPVAGATADGNQAASFSGAATSYLAIPHTSPSATIRAPFTVEAWANPSDTNVFANVVGSGGQYRSFDANGLWAGFSLGIYSGTWLFDLYNTNGNNNSLELQVPIPSVNQWYHLVATFDGTNANLYVNGTLQRSGAPTPNGAGQGYVPDNVNPILLGSLDPSDGFAAPNTFVGSLDEVAIYTNVLSASDILNHYQTATNPFPATAYKQTVQNGNPLIYLRLDEPAYVEPQPAAFSSFPVATNYGSLGASANGFYQPGTMPGVAGPSFPGFKSPSSAVAINGLDAAVDVGNGNLPSALNPIGNPAFSVISWFKANPSDGYQRFQNIMGHSDSSWRFGFDNNGLNRWNPGNGPELQGSHSLNDGNWHMLAGVSDGTNAFLYLDGVLDQQQAGVGTLSGSSVDVILGGDPQYTGPYGRYWAGSIAQVAYFTNAVTATQIQQLYNAAIVSPIVTLNAQRTGGNLVLTWSQGTLQSASQVTGPYTNILSATSPFTVTPSAPQQFFRVKVN
ncbi:MAG: cell surface protein [Pedosphaera sp.]|nr:cell surface protein [Pedosphaera sp.]